MLEYPFSEASTVSPARKSKSMKTAFLIWPVLAFLASGPVEAANVKLLALITHGGTAVDLLQGDFTTLDPPFTVNCSHAAGCTLIIDSIGTIGHNTNQTITDEWELCAKVDGAYGLGCTVQGVIRNDAQSTTGLTTGSTRQVFHLTHGNHTAQLYGDANDGHAQMVVWQALYYIYNQP